MGVIGATSVAVVGGFVDVVAVRSCWWFCCKLLLQLLVLLLLLLLSLFFVVVSDIVVAVADIDFVVPRSLHPSGFDHLKCVYRCVNRVAFEKRRCSPHTRCFT